jgi:molybdate transport system substrate-binding protein
MSLLRSSIRITAAALLAVSLAGTAKAQETPIVFAAASLTNAFQDIGKLYKEKAGAEAGRDLRLRR